MVEINNKYIKSINYLISKKTNQIPHHGKSFFQHLINVYNTLRKWNCNEDICYAGLFHSIYGNEIFKIKTEDNREIIKEIIGEKAEQIVFDFNQNRMFSDETKIINFANSLDHDFIDVIDNFFDKKDIDDFYFYFRDDISWSFTGGGKNLNLWRKFIYDLKFETFIERKLKETSSKILENYGFDKFLNLERTYASANPYGTVHESHQDYPASGAITIMYYLNNNWNIDYAGETVFYCNDKQDIIKSIIPKPGRIVIFDGTIFHCARDVRRDVNDLRMVLTFKYSLNIKNYNR